MGFRVGTQRAVKLKTSRKQNQHLLDVRSAFLSPLKHACTGCVILGTFTQPL